MEVLVATQGPLQMAAAKTIEGEAKVDMVRVEMAEFVLGRVERVMFGGHAAKPLKELEARGQKAGYGETKSEGTEGAKGGDRATGTAASAGCKTMPEQGGGGSREPHAGGKGGWGPSVQSMGAGQENNWLLSQGRLASARECAN